MRYPASEKAEIIHLVEASHLPASAHWTSSASRAPPSIAGTIAIATAGSKRWPIIARGRTASGTASPTRSGPDHRAGAARNGAEPARAGGALHRREGTSSRKRRCIGC